MLQGELYNIIYTIVIYMYVYYTSENSNMQQYYFLSVPVEKNTSLISDKHLVVGGQIDHSYLNERRRPAHANI